MMLGIFILPFVGAIVATALGALWYGPLFGKQFMRAMGINPEVVAMNPQAAKKDMMIRMGLEFVTTFIMFFGFLTLMNLAYAGTYSAALIFALLFWFFILMPNKATGALWSGRNARDSWALFGMGVGYSLVSFAIIAPLFILLLSFF